MSLDHHVDKVGVVGAIIAARSAWAPRPSSQWSPRLVWEFLINDAVLAPLLVLSLAGLVSGWRRHGNPSALALGIVAAVMRRSRLETVRSATRSFRRSDR